MRDRPGVVLTRHFFTSLFDFGFLSDDGAESLKRALLGSLAVAIAIGLLLTRVFMAKYGALSAGPPDAYERAVVADHAFLMAVPMWIVAGAVGLVGHSLFPDQTDFRILMAEPLSRLTIFGSKLASLLLFGGLFVAGTHLALLPLAALTMMGAMKTGSILTTAMAFVFSSVLGSLFAALAIVAVHGLLVLVAPRARLLAFSGAVRSFLIGVLVLSLPLVGAAAGHGGRVFVERMVASVGAAGVVRGARAMADRRCESRRAGGRGRDRDRRRPHRLGRELRPAVSPVRSGDRSSSSPSQNVPAGAVRWPGGSAARRCDTPSAVSCRSRSGGASCIRASSLACWPPREGSC